MVGDDAPTRSLTPLVKLKYESSAMSNRRFILVLACFLGLIAGQRFTLPFASSVICLAMIAWSLSVQRNYALSLSLAVLSVFFSVDMGVVDGNQTPTLVRYVSYAYLIIHLVTLHQLSLTRVLIGGIFFMYLLLQSLLALQEADLSQLWRDVQTLFLMGLYLCAVPKATRSFDYSIITYSICGYLVSDLYNFVFLKDAWYGDYLNYSSTKFLVIWPSLYFLFKRSFAAWIITTLATILVLAGYGGRTLFLSYLLLTIGLALLTPGFLLVFSICLTTVFSLGLFFASDLSVTLESLKTLNALLIIFETGWSAFYLLDPVRYYESKLFFEQPLADLFFGNGLGAGLYDKANLLGFVGVKDTAFSATELSSQKYYGFHDVWVDWGVRFGLIPTCTFIGLLVLKVIRSRSSTRFLTAIGLVGCVAAFYGVAPLILTAAILLISLQSRTALPHAEDY